MPKKSRLAHGKTPPAALENRAMAKRARGIDKGKLWMSKDFTLMSKSELDDWYCSQEDIRAYPVDTTC